ncbi:MAG: hypothetical protein H6618_10315 [Deltaproteobacteria bacterium]|nr:hypothetical protein [Deltaproteobacteria bacterium]
MMLEFRFRGPRDSWIELEFRTDLRKHFVAFSDVHDTFGELQQALLNALHIGKGSFRFALNEADAEGWQEYEHWEIRYDRRSLELKITTDDRHLVLQQHFPSFIDFAVPLVEAISKIKFRQGQWNNATPDPDILQQACDPKAHHGQSA